MHFCKANIEETVLPPAPPPLPADLGQFKKLTRVVDNDGVGTMAPYMALKKAQREQEAAQEAARVLGDAEEDVNTHDGTIETTPGLI